MYRKTSIFGGVLLTIAVPLGFAQNPQASSPKTPEDLLATAADLVAWSYMQEPKPVPQPLPPPDKGVPQPDTTPSQPPAPQAPEPVTAQTFSGKIVKDSGKFMLKVSDSTSYQLDVQDGLGQYEGKNVKVTGTLETGGAIHVTKIEILS